MKNGEALLIPIELDRPRRLRFDFNALASYEEATGTSVLGDGLEKSLGSATNIRALLWAALLHEEPELTQQQVGAMMHLGNVNELSEKLRDAIAQAVPDSEGNAPAVVSRRRGKTSGP